jgi:hypothetical protein
VARKRNELSAEAEGKIRAMMACGSSAEAIAKQLVADGLPRSERAHDRTPPSRASGWCPRWTRRDEKAEARPANGRSGRTSGRVGVDG